MGIRQRPLEDLGITMNWIDAYRGRRVLLTGHSGFKGVWLSAFLRRLGADVAGVSRRPDSKLFELVGDDGETFYCDIRDGDAVAKLIADYAPEMVFHLAAQALVRKAYAQPRETFEINAQGTINVLDAIRTTASVKAAVAITTDKVYRERAERTAFVETDELGGSDPYSASKAAAELAVEAYRKSFFDDDGPLIASARAGNVIGGGDWAEDRLIPDFVRAIQDNTAIHLRNPNHIRPWQHVLEPIRGYLILGNHLLQGDRSFAEGWNFGPSLADAISVQSVAEKIIRLWGRGELELANTDNGPHENPFLSLNSAKAHDRLDWHPVLNIDDALRYTVDWYRGHLEDGTPAPVLLDRQINAFLEKL